MKKIALLATLFLASSFSLAKMQTYTIVNGGGMDDMALLLKDTKGKEKYAYCSGQCGNWFEPSQEDDTETLKKKFIGKKVLADISFEKNNDRVAGPDHDEKFYFIKKLKFINK